MVELLFGLGYRDTQCGAKIFHRRVLAEALGKTQMEGWVFDVDLLVCLRRMRARVEEIPVAWADHSGSQVDVLRDPLRMARDLFRLWAGCRINERR
jgi:hypothetical protein